MNPNNPDLDDLLVSLLSNKRKRKDSFIISSDDVVNDIKIICIDRLIPFVKELKANHLNSREIIKNLNNLEEMIEAMKISMEDGNNEHSAEKKSIFVLFSIHLELLKELKMEYLKNGRKFNPIHFLNNKKKKLLESDVNFKQNKNKKQKKDEYESDSEDETSEEEEDDEEEKDEEDEEDEEKEEQITRKSKRINKKKITKNDKKYGNDDGDDDDDDDDDDEEEEEDESFKYLSNNKLGKEFMEQVFKSYKNGAEVQDESMKYFSNLNNKEKKNALDRIKKINDYHSNNKPMLFQIMELDLEMSQKNHILKNYISLVTGRQDNKLKQWMDSVMLIPFGKYKGINLNSIKKEKIKDFLDNLQNSMDDAAYGHDEAKRQIIQMMGQLVKNPKAKGNILGIYGPPGNGKCFALDTPILMHDGTFKKVQDVKVGDIVMGDDSRPRNVLSLGRGEDEMYEVIPKKGESYTVNSEHILCLKSSGLDCVKKTKNNKYRVQFLNTKTFDSFDRANKYLNELKNKKMDDIIEITVKDYLELPTSIKSKLKGYKVGVDFPKKEVDFDPYIIGVWLGDGSSDGIKITNQDTRILSYLRNELQKYNLNLHYISHYDYYIGHYDYSIVCDTNQNTSDSMNQFENALKKYNLLNNKHIPYEYKVNDRETRLKILAGIIDTDGYYNETMKNYEIIQKSKQLSDDILYLARSLGFVAHQYKVTKSCEYKGEEKIGDYYRTEIYGEKLSDIPILCLRKQSNDDTKDALVTEIEVVSKGRGNYYGFTLDGNNRFLLGDFTVTHNTTLIKEGIAKAMDKPFVFISLGGATDASFLEGHSFTYEGSIYGRIVNGLIASKCMDPIIYFDELDKISQTPKGDEITNILVHLTDPVQNSHFRDKYFHGIDIDLSKATIIFSYNDRSNVNRILLDRITNVETKYLLTSQKIHIAKNYLLPEMYKDMGFNEDALTFSDDIIRNIINKYTHEGGARKLKSLLYNIIREINIANLTNSKIDGKNVTFPFVLKPENITTLLKHKLEIEIEKINDKPKCGIVNGLYAGSIGVGGVLPIEVVWVPASKALELKTTGHLEKVIKESTEVACSLAWNFLDDNTKDKFLKFWKKKPMGFHIHCPDGATPKDGPSAGAALTLALYSLLTNRKIKNNVAMTGEINLQGRVTQIGGLEEKLEGAKRAGVTLALVPKENQKHLDKIVERNSSLFDDTFKVEIIETFEDVIKHALLPFTSTDTPIIKGFFDWNNNMTELDLNNDDKDE